MNLGLNNFQYRSGDQHTFGDLGGVGGGGGGGGGGEFGK